MDDESRDWLESLSVGRRDEALDRLRTLLLRATRFEVARRRNQLPHVDDRRLEELACTAADAAVKCAVAQLDRYRGESRFTTWAAKFALLEAAVRLRELAWRETSRTLLQSDAANQASLALQAILDEGIGELTADQRQVLEALTIHGVPIDVLAERMQTTRGEIYQKLSSARRVLRDDLMRQNTV